MLHLGKLWLTTWIGHSCPRDKGLPCPRWSRVVNTNDFEVNVRRYDRHLRSLDWGQLGQEFKLHRDCCRRRVPQIRLFILCNTIPFHLLGRDVINIWSENICLVCSLSWVKDDCSDVGVVVENDFCRPAVNSLPHRSSTSNIRQWL